MTTNKMTKSEDKMNNSEMNGDESLSLSFAPKREFSSFEERKNSGSGYIPTKEKLEVIGIRDSERNIDGLRDRHSTASVASVSVSSIDTATLNGMDDLHKKKRRHIPLTVDDLKINAGENAQLKREEFMKTFVSNVFENNNALFLYCKYVLLFYGKSLIEQKNIDALNFEIIKGGITNILVKFQDTQKQKNYLIRLYGPKTDEIINREREKVITNILCEANISKQIFVFFPNGRIEEYMEGYALTNTDLKDKIFQRKIAEKMRQLHDIHVKDSVYEQLRRFQNSQINKEETVEEEPEGEEGEEGEEETDMETEIDIRIGSDTDFICLKNKKTEKNRRSSFLWPTIWKYFGLLYSEKKSVHSFNSKLNILNLLDFEKLREKLQEIESFCFAKKSPVVLCHCDLLSSNIISKKDGTISFIDFEYSCFVERAFDIANHFVEYAGFTCNWEYLPTEEEEYNFIKHYLKTENECLIKNLLHEIQPFYLASHIYWGLWALLQAMHSEIDFDFIDYAMKRLTALYLPMFTQKSLMDNEQE